MSKYKIIDISEEFTTGEKVLEEIEASCYTEALVKALESVNLKVEANE